MPRPLDSAEAAERVLHDREALQLVLWELTRLARAKKLDPSIRDDAFDLAEALHQDPAMHQGKRPDFLERLLAEVDETR